MKTQYDKQGNMQDLIDILSVNISRFYIKKLNFFIALKSLRIDDLQLEHI